MKEREAESGGPRLYVMRVQVPVYSLLLRVSTTPFSSSSPSPFLSATSAFAGVVYRRGSSSLRSVLHLSAPLFLLLPWCPFSLASFSSPSQPSASFILFHHTVLVLVLMLVVVVVYETTRGHERIHSRMREVAPSAGESLTAGHPPPVPHLPLM